MARPHRSVTTAIGVSAVGLTMSGLAAAVPNAAAAPVRSAAHRCVAAAGSGAAATARQRVFNAAAKMYGVPRAVLLGVSYMESRWDNHGSQMSMAGGYGPMNLTNVPVSATDMSNGKGDGTRIGSNGPTSLHAAVLAHRLTGLPASTLEAQPAANVCGGAAVLASYQRQLGHATGTHTQIGTWFHAVRRYESSNDTADSARFATQVFETIKHGEARATNDGQRVRLVAHPSLVVPSEVAANLANQANSSHIDCPSTLNCQWVPAPYEWYGKPNPYLYGNHDLANRPADLHIDYIVIHDTEGSYASALQLVQDPTYLAWNYTIRSRDGHVAQHLDAKNVGWHAGNWYVNMHSIGIEHEGYAAQGASWYTEAMYENSAALVAYLAHEYGIPLNRAHIIGHDQVPGITPEYVAGMHWDPGPYWNWQHYFDLLGAPITRGTNHGRPKVGDVITVVPGFAHNIQPVTGCDGQAGDPCPRQGTNFLYLHTAPKASSPLVPDIGLHPDGAPSTTYVSDWGPRADAGQRLVVAKRSGKWLGVWWEGELGWMYAPARHSPVRRVDGHPIMVSAKPGMSSAPVYGRAYPEASAYPADIPYQTVEPLQYSIEAGQHYVLADANIQTDYYYAQTYHCRYVPDDCTDVVGKDKYYEIWFGHRMAYVRAADVALSR